MTRVGRSSRRSGLLVWGTLDLQGSEPCWFYLFQVIDLCSMLQIDGVCKQDGVLGRMNESKVREDVAGLK